MKDFNEEMKSLIKKEGLDNPDIFFADYETFEEIPLFSRWKNISFLSHFSFDEKNIILLRKCIDLVAYCYTLIDKYLDNESINDYFIAISLTGWDDHEEINCLTPNLVISRRKKWLLSNLKLKKSQTIEENIARDYLLSLACSDYEVFVSDSFKKNKRVYLVRRLFFEAL